MKWKVGDTASFTKTISEADITLFAAVCGDTNPVHFDEIWARSTAFGGRIAHGMIAGSMIGTVLGTKLPGPGTVYLSQSLAFRAPVRIGDTVTATATISRAREDKPIFTLQTECTNQDGTVVVKGEAVVLFQDPDA